jgi:tripartite-type tricarboxylate transporter receptor subunit TctC
MPPGRCPETPHGAAMSRRRLALGALMMAGGAIHPASAQAPPYPERPIRGVVPFSPGGASDILARLYAEQLGRALRQPVVVENRPGAGGNIGIQAAAQARPDGHTILFCSIATTQNPAMFRRLPYDPFEDVRPVAKLGEAQFVIAANAEKMPVASLGEFVALLRANPGKYNAAAGAVGTQLAIEVFRLQNGLRLEIVMYNGAGRAATSLLTGETDFIIVDAAPLSAIADSPKIRFLAVTGQDRLPAYPDVPTTREAGLPDYQESSHFGVYVPARTPDAIVGTLHAVLNEINRRPDVAERLRTLGWTPVAISTAAFEAFYRADIAKWKEIVRAAGISPLD